MEVVRVSLFFMKPFCSGFLPVAILLCTETEFGKGLTVAAAQEIGESQRRRNVPAQCV
ncbi:hypothetical protein MTR_5g026275 [Medicago truncatula]|uniref:Uncharacterized protein n=1 Tax=Medicago truncatula TaxID=3880 RepID=A0A072UP82_MEDTR|nr:hypothetical protein MTR_5g026275 [Medicago truncatula]